MNIYSVFVESMKRLHRNHKIDEAKIVELFESKKINEEELKYILEVNQVL